VKKITSEILATDRRDSLAPLWKDNFELKLPRRYINLCSQKSAAIDSATAAWQIRRVDPAIAEVIAVALRQTGGKQ
jgi:hypothetical protein